MNHTDRVAAESRPRHHAPADRLNLSPRVLWITCVSVGLGLAGGLIAQGLTRLIALITNLSFYGRLSVDTVSPADNAIGAWVLLVPVIGGLIVGGMARFGSAAIRGHGIPEAMEQVLFNQSRIPPRITVLKPLSAAVAIGTGGPFGAEGPIIATGGAFGSLVGQLMPTTADERKALLAAGAAAGMSATFGAPVSAVLLAIELLLFEYHPRSLIPVALASVAAAGVRIAFQGSTPAFEVAAFAQPSDAALASYVALGAVMGLLSVFVTRAVYWIEDCFAELPVHWMWWPTIGGVAVGAIGWIAPRTLGVGYDNIENLIAGTIGGWALVRLTLLKFASWSIALGSGTSGGTLAPLFTIGAGAGALICSGLGTWLPALGVDPRIGALVGMASIFAGASRALLASVVFAFETTRQPLGLLPLLGGCTAAYLVSSWRMRHSIMTEKIARHGARVPEGYTADYLERVLVGELASRPAVTLRASDRLGDTRRWIASEAAGAGHQGFPLIDDHGELVGVLTRRDLFDPRRADDIRLGQLLQGPAVVVFEDSSLREAADLMVQHDIGRLPVLAHREAAEPLGMITRSDLLLAHQRRLDEAGKADAGWRRLRGGERGASHGGITEPRRGRPKRSSG